MPDARSGRIYLEDSVSNHAERQASPFSRGEILKHLFVQRQIRHQLLQSAILVLELLQSARLVDVHPAKLLAPAVQRLDVHPEMVRMFRYFGSRLSEDKVVKGGDAPATKGLSGDVFNNPGPTMDRLYGKKK